MLFLSISFFISNNMIAQSKKELKKQQAKETYQKTKKIIENEDFVFEAEWAISYKGRRVNIDGDGSSLIMKQNESKADLPFFGRAFSGAGYGGNEGGIKFEVKGVTYDKEHNDKKTKTLIKFIAADKSANYEILLTVYSNGNANLSITNSNKSNMSYEGKIVLLKDKKEYKKETK